MTQLNFPSIRLVAVDLDGTLLDDAKRVGEKTAAAIRALGPRGIPLVIASARPPRSVRPTYDLLGLDTLQINYNGALVWDEQNRRPVFHQPLPPAVLKQLVAEARGWFPEILVGCEITDRWYTDRVDDRYLTETARLFPPDVVAPFDTFCDQCVSKLMLLGEPAVIDDLQSRVLQRYADKVIVVRQDPDLIQIADYGVSKATALRRVADHYGVPIAEVLAIGDAANDVEMIRAAGIGVAMANGHPDAKAVADWVAPSNNDEGVYAALERWGLVG